MLEMDDTPGLEPVLAYEHGPSQWHPVPAGLQRNAPSGTLPSSLSQPQLSANDKQPTSTVADAEQRATGGTIAGLRKLTFWLAFALVLVVLAAAVLGGVLGGVVLTRKKSNSVPSTDNSSSPTASTSLQTSAPHIVSTATAASATPSTTLGPSGVVIECPAVDNQTYSPPTSPGRTFLRQCNTNWGSREGAIDVAQLKVSSMQECIEYCARYSDEGAYKCIAVTWVYEDVQGTGYNYCWIKSKLGGKTFFDNMESALLVT